MAFTDYVSRILTMRRFLKTQERIAIALEQQTQILQRIADVVAPTLPPVTPADLKQTSATFNSYAEQGRIQDYVDRVLKEVGREPTDEEVVAFLDGEEQRV